MAFHSVTVSAPTPAGPARADSVRAATGTARAATTATAARKQSRLRCMGFPSRQPAPGAPVMVRRSAGGNGLVRFEEFLALPSRAAEPRIRASHHLWRSLDCGLE